MPDIRYIASDGEAFCIGGAPISVGTADALRGSEWSYSLGGGGLSGAALGPREVRLPMLFGSRDAAESFAVARERDTALGTPGRIECGGWSRRCNAVGCEVSRIWRGFVAADVTFALLDGVWRRQATVSFAPGGGARGDGLDLPYGLPYDLAAPAPASSVECGGYAGCPVGIIVYGPASSPRITIGGNVYKVDADVPDGGYLTVDPVSEPKRVTVTDPQGDVADAYSLAVLGDGEGSGSYLFERVPCGTSRVSWDGSFGFDLVLHEERGELPWTL